MQSVIRHNPVVAVSRCAVALLAAITAQSLQAVDVIKENNVDNLNLGSSWVGLAAPGSSDVAVWSSTVAAANATVLGADTSWSGIRIANPGGLVTINAGNTLTLGTAGIDMSAATQNLVINAPVALGGNQTWNVATGRSLNANGIISGSNSLTKDGAGTLFMVAGNTFSAGLTATAGSVQTSATGNTTGIFGTGAITLNGGRLRTQATGSVTYNNAIVVNSAGGILSFRANSFFNPASLTGTGTLTLNLDNNVTITPTTFANFGGTVSVTKNAGVNPGFFRMATAFVNNSMQNMVLDLGDSISVTRQSASGSALTIDIGTLTGAGTASSLSGNGTGMHTYSIGSRNESSSFAGSLLGTNVALTKVGTGTLTLSGNSHTYSGPTLVNAGTLRITGTLPNTAVTVGASGTLGGTGTINGATTVNGTLRPNTAPVNDTARLSFSGSLALAGSTTFDIDVANFTGVTISTAEALTFGGALNINFLNGVNLGTYDLFAFTDSDTGDFASVDITSIGGLTLASDVWSGTHGGNSYSFSQLTGDLTVSAIPEPSTFAALLGAAGLGFAAWRRRRRAA